MPICPSCGSENPEGFRFCGTCGAAFVAAPATPRETRKTVTVVFCDVTGSTALGERLDPESLRHVMARYFEAMREVIERHEGTVEKFIGDAVMAVFGVPVLHEDDALRAVRAVAEMREALVPLNRELERDYGTTLALRIGVNTGEVVSGTEERLATGDAVNVAARLEDAAQPDEILIGPETLRLVRDAVDVEPLEPLELKGKNESVPAYRLVAVGRGATGFAPRLEAPMVGRGRERRLLVGAWERVVSERSCSLFTLLGSAGVGKSRLAAEFLGGLEARVLRGRCLSYGDGITYWPVVEIVTQLLGAAPRARAAELGLDGAAVDAVASLLGEASASSSEEIARAVRKLLEAAAAERSLAVVFDDIHWGEPTFLDLIEHVADLSRGAPILLFCIARPELLDRRPEWGGGMLNATTVLLEPLSGEETDELIERLLGDAHLDASLRTRIRETAEGNPLFVEEMLAMLREGGDGEADVPPTIQALLAARLDQLDPSDRGVLERGSVEGKVFHRGAVQALAPEELQVDARLTTLVRKELVRPERATLPGEDAFRFRHLLIRDAAYDSLPKATRAELHERFAEWLDERGHDLVEHDEIVGYHLEQAYRYRKELGPVDDAGQVLARRAAERLVVGGRTALTRRDVRAAAGFLSRAADLLPGDDRTRLEVLLDLSEALFDIGDLVQATRLIEEAIEGARACDDERLRAHADLGRLRIVVQTDPSASTEDALRDAEETVSVFERLGDDSGLAAAWAFVGRMRFFLGQAAAADPAYEQALEYARRAGDRRQEHEHLEWWAGAKRFGPAPPAAGIAFLESFPESARQDARLGSWSLVLRAAFEAMEGRFDSGRALIARAKEGTEDFGLRLRHGAHTMDAGYVELLAGDAAAAERVLHEGYELLGFLGETGFRSSVGALLAEALCRQGRDEEAERIIDEVMAMAQADDVDPQARSRAVRAKLFARRGELAEAERIAREGVTIAERTDYLDLHGDTLVALGEVLRVAGRPSEAAALLRDALALYERKGNLVSAETTRDLLAKLDA